MSKVIMVGNDTSIPGRIERGSRAGGYRGEAVEIEVLLWAEFGNLGRKQKPVTEEEETLWTAQNGHRIDLIYKELNPGLSVAEQAELVQLDEEADRYLDRVAPLPLDHIKEFQAAAEQILARQGTPALSS